MEGTNEKSFTQKSVAFFLVLVVLSLYSLFFFLCAPSEFSIYNDHDTGRPSGSRQLCVNKLNGLRWRSGSWSCMLSHIEWKVFLLIRTLRKSLNQEVKGENENYTTNVLQLYLFRTQALKYCPPTYNDHVDCLVYVVLLKEGTLALMQLELTSPDCILHPASSRPVFSIY